MWAFEGFETGGVHQARLAQGFGTLDVDVAPSTICLARRKANHVSLPIHAFADSVDPSEAERLVDGLRVGNAGLSGRFLVEADPKLVAGIMPAGEPIAKLGGR